MEFDTHSLFGYSNVLTVISQSAPTAIFTVLTGDGQRFSTKQQVVIFPPGVKPLMSNAMVARITDISGDQITIDFSTANREGSSQRTILPGYQILNANTPKTFTDIEEVAREALLFSLIS